MIISGWSKQTNNMKQPWIFGEPYTTINRKYLKLKQRLTPYLYTYSREAFDSGVPTVRAMVLEFPDDPATWSKRTQYQFMSGEWLLVAPVYQDAPVRDDIYLPAGKWIDYWDGAEFNGPTTINGYAAPLDKLPLFVKAGAIIPMYPDMLYDGQKPADPVTLDVYPSGKTSFSLYQDDGTTQKYRTGAFARTTIDVESPATPDAAGDTITVNVRPSNRPVRRHARQPPVPRRRARGAQAREGHGRRARARRDPQTGQGRQAQDKLKADFEAATEGWYTTRPIAAA